MSTANEKHCLFCERTEEEIPLVQLDYQGRNMWICPQHIPVLIHDPQKLVGRLPGAESMEAG